MRVLVSIALCATACAAVTAGPRETAAAIAYNTAPEYPESERNLGHEGVVTLKFVIEKDGRVGDIAVLEGDEPFVSSARDAVKKWIYEPARLNGESIATYKIVRIPFRLTDQKQQ